MEYAYSNTIWELLDPCNVVNPKIAMDVQKEKKKKKGT